MKKVEVDKDLCIGSASCVAGAPDIFDLGDDGKAYVKKGADLSDVAKIMDAARSCPVNAIKVYDQDGKLVS
ncbi:ferredoxin [Patescibacteria group bacterium]|nr:ferredoxin [Patescibacteria group bacterium]